MLVVDDAMVAPHATVHAYTAKDNMQGILLYKICVTQRMHISPLAVLKAIAASVGIFAINRMQDKWRI